MQTLLRARYPYLSLIEVLSGRLNMRQLGNESLVDYLERFEQERNVAKSQLGENFLDKFIEHLPDYGSKSSTEQDSLKKGAIDAMMAIYF